MFSDATARRLATLSRVRNGAGGTACGQCGLEVKENRHLIASAIFAGRRLRIYRHALFDVALAHMRRNISGRERENGRALRCHRYAT